MADAGQSLQETILAQLEREGHKEALKADLRDALAKDGWREDLKLEASRIVRERGYANVTAEGLAEELQSFGRARVPEHVTAQLLEKIRAILTSSSPSA